MSDYIDREYLVDYIHACMENDQLMRTATKEEVLQMVADVPSAVPEVIRCKDCKHYQFADNRAFGMPVKMCEWFGFEDVDDNDFCSRAERRGENDG